MKQPKGLYIVDPRAMELIYGPDERREIESLVNIIAPPLTSKQIQPQLLADVELIFSGWGGPSLSDSFLATAPQLKALFYGAGSVAAVVTDAAWDRGVIVTSAYAANAVPVAEFTLATIIFSLKHGWQFARELRDKKAFQLRDNVPGCYGTTVGLISMGMIAKLLLKHLRLLDLKILAYDPFMSQAQADDLGVTLVPLATLFKQSDVVSLHTPWLTETEGMITGDLIASMNQGATFINTARGAVVREKEMLDVLAKRTDLQAVLDVTHPEPPSPDSPLFTLPNVVLTPHIAGSLGIECRRMGQYMIEELKRYLKGEPLEWAVTRDLAAKSSHRPVKRKP